MRVAQHWSLCRDDALDAYQRALEIYVRRIDSLDPATEIAWMKVVVKHEALAVRRSRSELVPVEDVDLDGQIAEEQRPVDDLLVGRERVRRSAEALRRLKPDQARALMLKAQGMSYAEIGESLGWTYTKVNRCITEGRARFLKVYAEIEAGEECERFAPTLAALVGGTASADALLELRPHIRNCATCRATVRELHATRLGRLAALFPIPALVVPLRWVSARFGDGPAAPQPGPDGIVLRPPGEDVPELSPLEGITDLDELAAPLELPAAELADQPGRFLELKAQAYQWLHRLQGSDIATGAQIAAGTGGGRIATIGAVVGLCLSGLGAGTVCVVTALQHEPHHSTSRPSDARKDAKPAARKAKAKAPLRLPQPRPASVRPSQRPTTAARAPRAGGTSSSKSDERASRPGSRDDARREFDFETGAADVPTGAPASTAHEASASTATTEPHDRTGFEQAVQQQPQAPATDSGETSAATEFGGD